MKTTPLRRRLGAIKLDRDAGAQVDGTLELKLELILLREENVRLKSERHRPFDVGTMIDQLRLRAGELDRAETIDEAWSALGQYLLLRENLAQADSEVQSAIAALGERFPGCSTTRRPVASGSPAHRSPWPLDRSAGPVAGSSIGRRKLNRRGWRRVRTRRRDPRRAPSPASRCARRRDRGGHRGGRDRDQRAAGARRGARASRAPTRSGSWRSRSPRSVRAPAICWCSARRSARRCRGG